MLTFPSAQTTCAPATRPRWASESQPSSSDGKTQLTDFSQISVHASGAWHHSHPAVTFSIWSFYCNIPEWHVCSVRTWTPALMLHLTNPCAKWKVLSLSKPKGKIYKTKSLGHYITVLPLRVDGSNDNERVLNNPQSFQTGASLYSLVLYPRHFFSYPAVAQSARAAEYTNQLHLWRGVRPHLPMSVLIWH